MAFPANTTQRKKPTLAPNAYLPRRLHKNRTKYNPSITTRSHGKIYATAVIACEIPSDKFPKKSRTASRIGLVR